MINMNRHTTTAINHKTKRIKLTLRAGKKTKREKGSLAKVANKGSLEQK